MLMRELYLLFSHQLSNIFSDDVELNVNLIANFYMLQISVLVSVRDNCDGK